MKKEYLAYSILIQQRHSKVIYYKTNKNKNNKTIPE